MELHILKIFIYYIGRPEKVLQFITPLKSVYKQNFCFNEKNVFLNATEKVIIKNPYKNIFLINMFCVTFQSCPL
jgi:hypothetical protein